MHRIALFSVFQQLTPNNRFFRNHFRLPATMIVPSAYLVPPGYLVPSGYLVSSGD